MAGWPRVKAPRSFPILERAEVTRGRRTNEAALVFTVDRRTLADRLIRGADGRIPPRPAGAQRDGQGWSAIVGEARGRQDKR